jgi:hypothetical protein
VGGGGPELAGRLVIQLVVTGGTPAHELEIALKELLVLGLLRRERRCADAESRGVATTAADCTNSERGTCRDGEQNADKRAGAEPAPKSCLHLIPPNEKSLGTEMFLPSAEGAQTRPAVSFVS